MDSCFRLSADRQAGMTTWGMNGRFFTQPVNKCIVYLFIYFQYIWHFFLLRACWKTQQSLITQIKGKITQIKTAWNISVIIFSNLCNQGCWGLFQQPAKQIISYYKYERKICQRKRAGKFPALCLLWRAKTAGANGCLPLNWYFAAVVLNNQIPK